LTVGAKARSVAWAKGESWLVGAPEMDSRGREGRGGDRAGARGAEGSRTFVPTSMYPASLKTPRYALDLLRLLFMAPRVRVSRTG